MTGATVSLEMESIALLPGETVLEALERNGVAVLSSCRSGVCQSCLVQAVDGVVPEKAQQGLKDSLRAQGYFLSCVCTPAGDLRIMLPGEGLNHQTIVLESTDIGAGVRRVRLAVPDGFQWFAGQYITLLRNPTTARSYSIASTPDDGFLELHVRRIPGGSVSNWIHDELRPGHAITVRGPMGDCFYTPGDPAAPLLLAGTGTGLAPLYGILNDALRQNHRGPIHVFHGALSVEGLYYRDELASLADRHGIAYTACVLNGSGDMAEGIQVGAIDQLVLESLGDTKSTRAFLCGDPGIVGTMRKKLFLKGLSNRHILADPFIPAAGAA